MASRKISNLRADALSRTVSIKSQFDADFVRFSLNCGDFRTFEDFKQLLAEHHNISQDMAFKIFYTDPKNNDLLPISNNSNLGRALIVAKPLLRILIQRLDIGKRSLIRRRSLLSSLVESIRRPLAKFRDISDPQDFRKVSAIVDVGVIPDTCRRVRIEKQSLDQPLGMAIKVVPKYRKAPNGSVQKLPAILIHELAPKGLAGSSGLLGINDELLEINGVEVVGKTLQQIQEILGKKSFVTVITVKPYGKNLSPTTSFESLPLRKTNRSRLSIRGFKSGKSGVKCSDENANRIVSQKNVVA